MPAQDRRIGRIKMKVMLVKIPIHYRLTSSKIACGTKSTRIDTTPFIKNVTCLNCKKVLQKRIDNYVSKNISIPQMIAMVVLHFDIPDEIAKDMVEKSLLKLKDGK